MFPFTGGFWEDRNHHYNILSLAGIPHILVLLIPVVGLAMLENGNLFISTVIEWRNSCKAVFLNIPKTSTTFSEPILCNSLKGITYIIINCTEHKALLQFWCL